MLRTYLAFGLNDLKSINRDSLLFGVIIAPWLLVLSLRLVIPPLTEFLATRYQFDLVSYYPLVICFFLFLNIPLLFGVMTGFLMLDERDNDTLTALRVTPASLQGLVKYRLAIAFLFSTVYILITTPLSGLVKIENGFQILIPALLASLFAPVVTLFLAAFARNKLEGFALIKGAGVVLLGPLMSFFMVGAAQYLFGLLPTFWAVHAFVAALNQESYLVYVVIGLIYNSLLIALLYRRYHAQFMSSL
jgi:fluoroquinolone transport system permease protein